MSAVEFSWISYIIPIIEIIAREFCESVNDTPVVIRRGKPIGKNSSLFLYVKD